MAAASPSCRTLRAVDPLTSARAARRSSPTATSTTQRQYFLAAHADEVYLDPMGVVLLDGYAYYRIYFRRTRSTSSRST